MSTRVFCYICIGVCRRPLAASKSHMFLLWLMLLFSLCFLFTKTVLALVGFLFGLYVLTPKSQDCLFPPVAPVAPITLGAPYPRIARSRR